MYDEEIHLNKPHVTENPCQERGHRNSEGLPGKGWAELELNDSTCSHNRQLPLKMPERVLIVNTIISIMT